MSEFVDLLRQTVAIPSPSGEEAEVSRFLVSWMRRHNFEAEVDGAGSAVGVRGTGPSTVVLLGHIDTVPGEIPVRIENNQLWGRGSVDAKGPFCTFIAAVSQLSSEALSKARFVCIGAVEEESPSSKGAHHAVNRHKPDYVVIGEPSGFDTVTLGYKGRLIAKARLVKSNFHSAGDDTTAGEDVIAFWNSAKAWVENDNQDRRLFDSVQIAMQAMKTDSDGLYQRAEATIGLRLPPRTSTDEAIAVLETLRQSNPLWDGLQLVFVGREEPYRGPKDTTLSRAFRVAIRQHGLEPKITLKTGTSDMNTVAPYWQVPMLAYGPGDSTLDHTPVEHIELTEYENAIEILRASLERLVLHQTGR